MTREEAIRWLEAMKSPYTLPAETLEAFDMAIEALSAPTGGDLISRQDALNLSCEITGRHGDEGVIKACFEAYRDHINRVPSARPTGKWIPCSERLPSEHEFGWYLVTVKGCESFVDVVPFDDALWKGLVSDQEIMAWMPLPMPYREDGE